MLEKVEEKRQTKVKKVFAYSHPSPATPPRAASTLHVQQHASLTLGCRPPPPHPRKGERVNNNTRTRREHARKKIVYSNILYDACEQTNGQKQTTLMRKK